MTNAIARWHSESWSVTDPLEKVYADKLEAEMQEMAIQLHQVCAYVCMGGGLLLRAVPEIIPGGTFFFRPSTPRTHMESEPPRPPGHVSALINLPHYGSNTPWPPGQVTSPPPTPRTHCQQNTLPHRTKKCLRPTHPEDNFWNSLTIMGSVCWCGGCSVRMCHLLPADQSEASDTLKWELSCLCLQACEQAEMLKQPSAARAWAALSDWELSDGRETCKTAETEAGTDTRQRCVHMQETLWYTRSVVASWIVFLLQVSPLYFVVIQTMPGRGGKWLNW